MAEGGNTTASHGKHTTIHTCNDRRSLQQLRWCSSRRMNQSEEIQGFLLNRIYEERHQVVNRMSQHMFLSLPSWGRNENPLPCCAFVMLYFVMSALHNALGTDITSFHSSFPPYSFLPFITKSNCLYVLLLKGDYINIIVPN